jgi:glycosyl transferase, family 25
MANPHTVVINLQTRPDRRAEMELQLAKIGWSAEFETACRPADRGGFPSIGARGCFMSHLAVLRKSIGAQRLVILEDDVNFVPDFSSRWLRIAEELETLPWSISYLGHYLGVLPDSLTAIAPSFPVQCTHFMLIEGPAIPILVQELETILSRPAGHPDGGPMHVDGAYSTIRAKRRELNTYVVSPPLGFQRPSRTDIGDLAWFDRSKVLRPLVSFARYLKAQRV